MSESETQYIDNPELDVDVAIGIEARVILFNDNEHSFEEVISQLTKATGCGIEQAEAMTFEVHYRGRASVGNVQFLVEISRVLTPLRFTKKI